jgi:hypothetical protein
VENTRDAIMQGIYVLAQAIPSMAQQGMDPVEPIRQIAEFGKQLQKGKQPEDIAVDVFAPKPKPAPPTTSPAAEEEGMGGPPPEGGAAPGVEGQQGVTPPGTTPQMPGARPDISIALAGLTSAGRPQMSNTVSRRRAV